MNIKKTLWILPFISFIAGYLVAQWFFQVKSFPAPHLIGKNLQQALPIISDHQLNIRLINQKEERTIPEGIILHQTPSPGSNIKINQPLFIITTKKPTAICAPNCIGIDSTALSTQLANTPIQLRLYSIINSIYPKNMCFAQYPEKGQHLENNKLIVYLSGGTNRPIVWPSFIGQPLEQAENLLSGYNIVPHIIDEPAPTRQQVIIDQRPQAGTLITLDEKQPLLVQFRIQKDKE